MKPVKNRDDVSVGTRVCVDLASGARLWGTLVSTTPAHAVVHCEDGKRRRVPWMREWTVEVERVHRVCAVRIPSEEEAWAHDRPLTKVLRHAHSFGTALKIEFDLDQIDTHQFLADVAALTEWVRQRPTSAQGTDPSPSLKAR